MTPWPLLAALLAASPDAWHLSGWSSRAVVEIAHPAPGADSAALRLLLHGRAKPDGSDLRVLDAAGKPVPFQVAFLDAPRYALISFRASDPKQHHYVYFNNAQASRAPEQIPDPSPPGAGPPKADWVPRQGLILETMRRPEGDNPKTVEEMTRLIADSPGPDGARYQRRISDGFNPFGSSDRYMSLYRGWIQVPTAGKYAFCTASNEASFSFLDGKPLVHWPGRHTTERGLHGEKKATVELTAGPHYVEYYQEEVVLEQMAFLGWRPLADSGPFQPIPESAFPAPHEAVVVRYETAEGKSLPAFEPEVVDSVWPADRRTGQYTHCRFRAVATPDKATCRWDFGDGQSATGAEAEHVYLTTGRYKVTLTANGSSASWPFEVFEIENVNDQFPEGRPRDYAKLARGYDRSKLDAKNLGELAHLLAESEDAAGAVDAGKEFLARYANAEPKTALEVRRLIADASLRLGQGGVDEAITQFEASLTSDTPPVDRLDALARLIRLVGIERSRPDAAGALLPKVEEAVKGAKLADETLAAYRRAIIAAADVLLWNGKLEGARGLYKRAETLSGRFIPGSVRAARIGAYPGAIREAIDAGNLGTALDIVDQWDETFPTDKPNGQSLFWRGKLLALRGQPREAARHLARAVGLAPGAPFETEARWLLAESLERSGRPQDARRELAKLVASGLDDPFTRRAREKLKP